jgi:cysteamine dioxygenase
MFCHSLSVADAKILFPAVRLAKLVVDDVFRAPCDTSVLYPTTGGNMHRFTAIAPCAILDILGPPYSIEEDRDCTYYTDIPYTHHSSK